MKENREEGKKKKRNLIEHTDERLQPTLSSTRRPEKKKKCSGVEKVDNY